MATDFWYTNACAPVARQATIAGNASRMWPGSAGQRRRPEGWSGAAAAVSKQRAGRTLATAMAGCVAVVLASKSAQRASLEASAGRGPHSARRPAAATAPALRPHEPVASPCEVAALG